MTLTTLSVVVYTVLHALVVYPFVMLMHSMLYSHRPMLRNRRRRLTSSW